MFIKKKKKKTKCINSQLEHVPEDVILALQTCPVQQHSDLGEGPSWGLDLF